MLCLEPVHLTLQNTNCSPCGLIEIDLAKNSDHLMLTFSSCDIDGSCLYHPAVFQFPTT